MAVDMFLELDHIKGESLDKVHRGKIDILGWNWGVTNAGTFHQGHGGGTAKASFRDISITKYVDAASPDLVHSCASGKHFEKGKVIIRKAGQHPLEYLVISLERVFVSAYATGSKGAEEERLTEVISLHFVKVKLEYVIQAEKGGRGAAHIFHWDIASNSKVDL